MTRRVRFTPFVAFGCFLASSSARAADVPFVARPPIATGITSASGLSAADLDGDGDRDLFATRIGGPDAVFALENTNGDGSAWTTQTIATAPFGADAVVPADLDGDGDLDALTSDLATSTPFWIENGAGSTWVPRTMSGMTYTASFLAPADVDRDGDLDVVGVGSGTRVFWYENASGNASAWTRRTIATAPATLSSIATGDVDGDGDPDLVLGSTGPTHFWLENQAGNGSAWLLRTLIASMGDPSLSVVDLDRDGDLDVLGTGTSVPGWLENTAGNATTWVRRAIGTVNFSFRGSAVDVDSDGDADVLGFTGIVLLWFENAAGNASAWTPRVFGPPVPGAGTAIATDLDADGDLDVAASAAEIVWLRNETIHQNACFVPHTISTAVSGAQAVVPADVDGDGDLDAVSTAFLAGAVLWHDNTAADASAWVTRTIATALPSAAVAAAGDVDRDGDIDVAAIGAPVGAGTLAWFANTAGDGSAWTQNTVSTAFSRATHVELADVSGDGDLDLLGAGYYSSTLLFENAAGNGSAWTAVALPSGGQTGVATGDLDRDGDLDVTSTESFFSDGLAWSENLSGGGTSWTTHTISTIGGATYAMAAVDVDGDGDLDVLQPGASFLVGTAIWYENVGGSASSWAGHPIPGAESAIATPADLDRDGDVDVVAPGTTSDLRFWENTDGTGLVWTQRTIAPTAGLPRQLAVADLDRDGDPDVLSATASTNAVNWYENRGGQASLAVVDQAPATANNGDLVSMLRATVTHLGRASDSPIELASLGLQFEETPGDPLTSAEANALVGSLRVYRDANGNGTFEPATDALVTTVPTLVLTNGVATVSFTDGDPNVQVAVGTPRAYFVVAEIAPAASAQVPNQFRVTLLQTGPSSSLLEDRTFDLPLRLACPVDVSSTVRQVVPVELSGFTVE